MNRLLKNRGMTIFETVVYVALLGVLIVFMLNALISVNDAAGTSRISREINTAAVTTIDRMNRIIRDSYSVDGASSTFDDDNGVLVLNGLSDTVTFALDGSSIATIQEGSSSAEPLMTSDIVVDRLLFTLITTTNSEAVKIELVVRHTQEPDISPRTFRSTAVLRGSY